MNRSSTETLPGPVEAELARRIDSASLDLPILPQAAGQVLNACQDDRCEIRELSRILHQDPSLAGHVLRLANSPLHMPTVPIVSLPQAISRLGTTRIRQIALIASCEARVFHVPGHQALVRQWFDHSLATALFAEEIARLKRWNVEEAFLGGLLHDVGRPMALQAILDIGREQELPISRQAAVTAADIYHAQAAGDLIRAWKLPEMVGEIVRWHEDPLAAPEEVPTARLVALADELSHAVFGPREVTEADLEGHPLLVALNLYPDDVEDLLERRETIRTRLEALR